MAHWCCNITPNFVQKPTNYQRVAGYGALITGVVMIVLACCLANGCFTPGMQAHVASYSAATLAILSLIPLTSAASILCQGSPKKDPASVQQL